MLSLTPVDIVIAFIAVGVLPALSAWSGRGLAPGVATAEGLTRRYWRIIIRSVLVMAFVVAAWAMLHRPFSWLGLGAPLGWRAAAGFSVAAGIAGYYVYALFLHRHSAEQLRHVREQLQRTGATRILPKSREQFALFACVAIFGSSMEELLYRGFLIWFLSPLTGVPGAVLLSAVVFGLGHAYQGRIGVIRTGLIGLAFAIGYVLTRSLWWLMLAHIIANMSAVLMQRRSLREAA